jgi:hypothetical protein
LKERKGKVVTEEVPDPKNPRPFSDLREKGLLWLINTTVFHPRGFALAMAFNEAGEAIGWQLLGDGKEPWAFGESCDPEFEAVERLFDEQRS